MKKGYIVLGLGYGDCGKGCVTDFITRQCNVGLVVRFNGGSQASHSVYTPDGRHHAFSQFGSGTFVPGVSTFLSRYMIINPLVMQAEEEHLRKKGVTDAFNRLFIDGRALITTPYHRAYNRLRELERGDARHGSCGAGVGETVADAEVVGRMALRAGDLHMPDILGSKLVLAQQRLQRQVMMLKDLPDTEAVERELSTFRVPVGDVLRRYLEFYMLVRERILTEYQSAQLINNNERIVFEGAQGVLLDENHGFHPYTTWSTTTARNAKLILEEAEVKTPPTVVGVTRTYATRHGPGPFITEDEQMGRVLVDPNNGHNPWQRAFRVGLFDVPAIRYALSVAGPVDCLAVTHMDAMTDPWPICVKYDKELVFPTHPPGQLEAREVATKAMAGVKFEVQTVKPKNFVPYLESALEVPVGITSHGPGPNEKEFHGLFARSKA